MFKATVVSAWQINLNWLEPAIKNGEIWGYEVDVRKELGNIRIERPTITNITFEAKNLEPFKNYTFSVKAIGSGGVSESVTVRAQTFTSSECDFPTFTASIYLFHLIYMRRLFLSIFLLVLLTCLTKSIQYQCLTRSSSIKLWYSDRDHATGGGSCSPHDFADPPVGTFIMSMKCFIF